MNKHHSISITGEIWKPLYDFPWYEVSNKGRVRKTQIRKLHIQQTGYNAVNLSYKGKQRKD